MKCTSGPFTRSHVRACPDGDANMLKRSLIGLLFIASSPLLAAEARSPQSMFTVTNIEALRGLPTAGQYATVNVQGYYTANDGGGGIFNWNSTSTARVDDCIVFGARGNAATGRYIRQEAQSSPYSVRWCG